MTQKAFPDSDQQCLGWSGDLVGTNNPVAVTMNSSQIIEALFTSRPSLQPDSANANAAVDGFRLVLKSDWGARVTVNSSSNPAAWAALLTVTNNFGTTRILDSTSAGMPWHFYRAVSE